MNRSHGQWFGAKDMAHWEAVQKVPEDSDFKTMCFNQSTRWWMRWCIHG